MSVKVKTYPLPNGGAVTWTTRTYTAWTVEAAALILGRFAVSLDHPCSESAPWRGGRRFSIARFRDYTIVNVDCAWERAACADYYEGVRP